MSCSKNDIVELEAIIPAKGLSRRVPQKNTRPFAGSTLLEIKIRQLLKVEPIARVFVSSEDEQTLRLAEQSGAVPLYRDSRFASDDIPMSEVYAYMASQLSSEYVLLTHVTNPLAGTETYESCIKSFQDNLGTYSSLTTVADVKDFLYLDGKAINFDPKKKPRSQDLPEIVKLTHVVSIAPRRYVVREKEWFDSRPFFQKLSHLESIDIDTLLDFEIAEFLYSRQEA